VLSFRRVGSIAGEISTLIENKSKNSHYFIRFKNGFETCQFVKLYKKIKFLHKNTVGQKSISQQELLLELRKYGI